MKKEKLMSWVGILLFVAVIGVTAFILINSFMDVSSSHNLSEKVTVIVSPKGVYGLEDIVRKLAHVVEFFALGVFTMLLSVFLHYRWKRNGIGFVLFYVLAVAVLDEHIQTFSDRTGSTSDIVLDFLGAFIGIALVWAVFKIARLIKTKKKS